MGSPSNSHPTEIFQSIRLTGDAIAAVGDAKLGDEITKSVTLRIAELSDHKGEEKKISLEVLKMGDISLATKLLNLADRIFPRHK